MKPRYIIHIGPLKTASTYMQECLTSARDDLAQQGICYPEELTTPQAKVRHIPVYWALARNQAETLRDAFKRLNAAGHHTIVLSCEHLSFLKPAAFLALRDVIGDADIRIVYTCRRWSDRASSIWNQTLFMGATQTLPEFYISLLAGRPMNYYTKSMKEHYPGCDVDYSIHWRAIADIFGRDALMIFPYSVIMDEGGDVFERFCQDVLGMAAAPKTALTGKKRWTSFSTPDQEILRMMNGLYLEETGKEEAALSTGFLRRRKHYDTARIAAAMADHAAEITIDDNAVQFDAAFDNMSAYTDLVVGAETMFARRSKPAAYIQSGYLLKDGVREDIRAMYHRIKSEVDTAQTAA